MPFHLPSIDIFSFLVGVILASLFWWLISLLRPAMQYLHENSQNKKVEKENKEKAQTTSVIEENYRRIVLQQAQALHLASSLFSLDEIIEPPKLLAPPARVEPGTPFPREDIVDTTIPYLPAWPDLGAIYHSPTLTLAEALSGNSDIVLTGHAGMGKTVTLAFLASRLARKDPEPGLLPEIVPFLMHVADLDLPVDKDDPLTPVIKLIAEKAAVLDLVRLPDFVQKTFAEGRALVLLDGTDELAPDGLKNTVEFIKAIKRGYPKTRMVTTSSVEYLDGLISLNFIPFSIAAWNSKQRSDYFERWGKLWQNFVSGESWAKTIEPINPLLLNSWLYVESINLTPLELTLKTWGAYAGDLGGTRLIDLIETHIRRLSPSSVPREAIEKLALQINLSREPFFNPKDAREWIKSFEPPELTVIPGSTTQNNTSKAGKLNINQVPSQGLITRIVESGLLTQHRNNRMRFIHPIFGGYLAAKASVNYKTEVLLEQPPWLGKFLVLNYLASLSDVSPLVEVLLNKNDRPLSRNLLITGRWLRDAYPEATWPRKVLAKLFELMEKTGQPLALRGQALSAILQSNDPSIGHLLRKLIEEQDSELLQLAALGSGALKDIKSIELLAALINSQVPNVSSAACLALVALGTSNSLDIVGSALLHGEEKLRRVAAEALANHPGEGYAMLKEGVAMKEDPVLRLSAVYGLGRIPEAWAEAQIDRLQLDDDQWAVRNVAAELVENRQRPNPHIPQRLPPPSESFWLINFAAKNGSNIHMKEFP